MKKVFVNSAEWNPDNEIILHIANCDSSGLQDPSTRKRIVIKNIEEESATTETVIKHLAAQEMEVFNQKFMVN